MGGRCHFFFFYLLIGNGIFSFSFKFIPFRLNSRSFCFGYVF